MSKNTIVDWSERVQRSVCDGEQWVDVEVLKVHRDGTATIYDPHVDLVFLRVGPEFGFVRNAPLWEDPHTVEFWVNVYPGNCPEYRIHDSLERAEKAARSHRMARVHVKFDGEDASCSVETF